MVHAVVLGVEIGVGVGARAAEPGPRAFVSSSETRFRSGDQVLGTVEDVPVAVRKWGEKVITIYIYILPVPAEAAPTILFTSCSWSRRRRLPARCLPT